MPIARWFDPPLAGQPAGTLDDEQVHERLWRVIERLFEKQVDLPDEFRGVPPAPLRITASTVWSVAPRGGRTLGPAEEAPAAPRPAAGCMLGRR